MRKIILIILVLIALFFLNGCMNILIETDVDYPEDLFNETREKIEAIHAKDPLRKGRVSKLNFLVYEGDDRKLVRFSIKKGMAKMIFNESDITDDKEIRKYSKEYAGINLGKIKNLDHLGPGLIVEIEVTDEDTHILVWLD